MNSNRPEWSSAMTSTMEAKICESSDFDIRRFPQVGCPRRTSGSKTVGIGMGIRLVVICERLLSKEGFVFKQAIGSRIDFLRRKLFAFFYLAEMLFRFEGYIQMLICTFFFLFEKENLESREKRQRSRSAAPMPFLPVNLIICSIIIYQ